MHALILCNGERPSAQLLARHLAAADIVICTDGAAAWAIAAGVHPAVIIGDMDSLSCETGDAEVVHAGPHSVQENTDSEKALLLALERGADEIVLLGATGRRLDHTLGNLWLAYRYRERAQVVIVDDYAETRAVSGQYELHLPEGMAVSIVPLTSDTIVRTRGLQWPLDEPLEPGTRGLSNRTVDGEAAVEVPQGVAAVIILTGKD